MRLITYPSGPPCRLPGWHRGASLIELMVGLTLLAMLVGMGVPAFGEWMRNAQIRTTAESIQSGLQSARAEAVKRNAQVRFQLVSSLENDCTVSNAGANWLINLSSSTTPQGQCGSAIDDTVTPFIIERSPAGTQPNNVQINASQYVVSFNGLGSQSASTNPITAIGILTIDVNSATEACLGTTGGTARCLRVVVSPAGQIRMCDPSITGSGVSTKTHPTAC